MGRKATPWYRQSRGRWYVSIQGKQTALPVTDPKDFVGALDAFRTILNGVLPQVRPIRPEPIQSLISEYLDAISHKISPRTKQGYQSYLRTFAARFGNVPAVQIDRDIVERHAMEQGWSDSNRSNFLWAVQAFIRWCGRNDFALSRPAKESRGSDSVISDEFYAEILRETTGDFHQYIRFLWNVGCRPMEAANLTVEAVDWATGTVVIKRHKTRHKGKRRVLYLSSEALAIIQKQATKYKWTGSVFRGMRGKPLSLQAVVTRFIRLSGKLGKSVRAYDFRHSFVTRALAVGLPDTHVAALVGHANTNMLHKFYSHVGRDAKLLRDAAEKLAG